MSAEGDRRAADALLAWADKTHGNCFGHDHHCPVPDVQGDPYLPHPRDGECTCGWAEAAAAERER